MKKLLMERDVQNQSRGLRQRNKLAGDNEPEAGQQSVSEANNAATYQ